MLISEPTVMREIVRDEIGKYLKGKIPARKKGG